MANKVVVLNQHDYDFITVKEKLQQIIEIIVSTKDISNKIILIKPNCGPIAKPEDGLTVHPVVLKALIQIIKELNPRKLIVAESSFVEFDTMTAFKESGLLEVMEEEGINYFDLKKEPYNPVEINGLSMKKIKLPKILEQVDMIISLAKLKTNVSATVTLSIKNLKGLIPDEYKKKFHRINLANSIYDLYSCLKVDKIGIIDGILGSELYEPKKGNILAGSNDLISLDVHCSELMGFKREDVRYLNLFKKPRFQLISDEISTLKFNKTVSSLEKIEKEYKIKIIGRSFCSSCVGALMWGIKKAKAKNLSVENITFVIGPTGQNLLNEKHLISIGNCTAKYDNKGIHVAGCPPVSNQVLKAVSKSQDLFC